MDDLRKTLIMLSAAATMSALGTQAALAGEKEAKKREAGKDRVQRTKGDRGSKAEKGEKKVEKKKVQRVKQARRRAPSFSPDLAMPAGTLYDVVSRRDIA